MKIDLYQNDKECYFWTKDELGYLEEQYPRCFVLQADGESLLYKGHELRIYRGRYHQLMNGNINEDSDYIIIVLTYNSMREEDLRCLITLLEKNPEKKFLFVAKNVEDYWIINRNRIDDELLVKFGEYDNVTILWDVAGVDYKNFYFEPKVNIQNYYNNSTFPGFMFINGGSIFHSLEKKYRMGIHLNKITDNVRKYLYNTYSKNTNSNLFFTSKAEREDTIFSNEIKVVGSNAVTNDWYNEQFVELTIKSQMEVIYETFTTTSEHKWLLKWNEKTIKQLFLSKPFIHSDPVAHSLFKVNGLKAYRSLYTDKLWDMYEGYNNKELLHMNHSNKEIFWKSLLDENIEWLLNMSVVDWTERINEANRVAIENRRIIEEYIFNQSLFNYVK